MSRVSHFKVLLLLLNLLTDSLYQSE